MKKIIITFLVFFLFISKALAHPLDISVSTWNIRWETMSINTYFHSFEVEYLFKNKDIIINWVDDYYENKDIIVDYIKQNARLKNNWKNCNIWEVSIDETEAYDVLTKWLSTNYSFICDEKIDIFSLNLDYFLEFKLQTNRITIYDLNNGIKDIKPIIFKVLTPKLNTLDLDLNNLNVVRVDSDWDWLSDEEEKVYLTNHLKIDTDWDNYTDKEEIDFGWDPLNPNLWPWQEYREKLDIIVSQKNIDSLQKINETMLNKNLSDYWYNNWFLNKVMKYINDYFEKNTWNLSVIFFIVYILWILHAAWPGHSKWLLIAYTLEKENSYKKWILFSIIFTITHIIDIIILFIISKIIINLVDPGDYIYFVQLFSAIILFILSIYLIYRAINIKEVRCEKNKKPTIYIAFLAWLAPCSFAWSIFLLLSALWKTMWILPLIIALWLWIFTTLIAIVFISVYLKNKAYEKVWSLWKYSSIISSFIILIISIILLYNLI